MVSLLIITGSTLSMKIADGNSVKNISLDFVGSPVSTPYTYTFPAASGTISLLESTQTFTGVNTFSALTSFTFSSGTRMDYGPYLTKGSVPTVFSGTTTNIYSDATTNNIVIRDTSSIAKLVFNNSTQTFTFPAATGTIALTSNLSSYVPYTGATTDLNLGLFNLYANQLNTQALDINTIGGGSAPINFYMSSVQKASIGASSSTLTFSAKNTNGFQFQNPSNAIIFSISNTGVLGNGTYSYTLPSATGTLALTSNITSAISGTTNYHAKFTGTNTIGNSLIWDNGTNVGIGNTNTSYTLDVSGTGRFTGNVFLSNGSGNKITTLGGSPSANDGASLELIPSNSARNWAIRANWNVSGALEFVPSTAAGGSSFSTTPSMIISSAGLVGIGSGASGNPAAYGFFAVSNVITVNTLAGVAAGFSDNTYGTTRLYIQNGINGINVDQAFVISTGGGVPVERMRITSGGNVGIGTNNPTEILHLYTSAGPELRMESSAVSWYIRAYNDNFNVLTPTGRQAVSFLNNGDVRNYNKTTTWQQTSDARVKEKIKTNSDSKMDFIFKL